MNSGLVSAIRGPIMLITVGVLFAIDHAGSFRIHQSWPVLLVVFGALKLLEKAAAPPPPPPAPAYPPAQPTAVLPPERPPFRKTEGEL